MQPLKTCTGCGEAKAAATTNFYRHPDCRGGLDSACRVCRNAQRNEWKHRNSERLAVRRRAVYAQRYGERQRALEAQRAARRPLNRTIIRECYDREHERAA